MFEYHPGRVTEKIFKRRHAGQAGDQFAQRQNSPGTMMFM